MALEAMLTIFVELIKTPINDYVVSPVKRHLRYAFKCDSQLQNLREAVVLLKNKKDRIENSVVEATRRGDAIYENVTAWLNNVETCIGEAEKLMKGKDKNGIGEAEQLIQGKDKNGIDAKQARSMASCPNLKTRYQLSKKADKKASVITKLVQEAEGLNPISYCPPLEPIVEPSVYAQEALTSRLEILDQIIDALKDPNLNMIGVYGMGGVGKTTLAKEVQAKAMQDKMFENVVLVSVSQTVELRKIQSEIADFLGLKFDAQEIPGRASQLYKRLERSKVLIILDDIWHRLDLNAVGIPSGDSCKLMLTSRRRDVLRTEMGAQKEFLLGTLGEEDAWKLFRTIAPKSVDPQFHATATEVSKKCSGLPLLIFIVANKLKNKELYEWANMLKQLSVPGNEDIYERVHKVLKKSFKKLPNEAKSLFLLCSMFAQSNIQIQMLLVYSMGLGIFKYIETIQEARNRLLTLINELKDDCLFLDGDKGGSVKMHDVVRDSAISIASRLQHAFVGCGRITNWPSQNCTKISLPYCDVRELPGDLECPEADLFFLFTEDLSLGIPDSFFKGSRKLKVVEFTGMRMLSLPSSLGLLPNLHTLSLQRCRLNSVAVIGELKQLQLLSLADSKISELPREIEELTQLKLLDLSNCTMLRVIPPNVLSKLCLLEELYMMNSFDQWDTKGNASIMELECLSLLSTLEVKIVNLKLIPRGFRFFDGLQLDSFRISMGVEWSWYVQYEKCKELILNLDSSVQLGQQIEGSLRVAEVLSLDGVWGINFNVENFPQLKHLFIENDCGNIQHLIKPNARASCQAFGVLESMNLVSLESMEKICDGQLAPGSFGKLKKLIVKHCHKLKSLFSVSSVKCMSQLQELELHSCGSLEAVVGDWTEDGQYSNEVIEFSQLKSLKLSNLPKLKCFYKKEAGTAQVKLLFNETVSFPNLMSLEVCHCYNFNYIFTTSTVKCFGQLKNLEIGSCSVKEIMVMIKSGEIEESIDEIAFPKLDNLHLEYLAELRGFFYGHVLEFPSLKTLTIKDCRAMENFVSKFSSSSNNESKGHFFKEMVTLSNLETLEACGLDSCRYLWDEKFIAGDSFCKLLSLTIKECSKLQVIFPSNAYRRFQSLENLTVHFCDDVKEIYQYEGVDFDDDNNVPTFALRKLDISNLQSLKHIWSKDSYRACTFQSLQSVSIIYCEDNLEYIFPESIACDLVQLQQLYIGRCSVEMIIAKKSKGCPASFEFPELTSIELSCLDKMRSICEGPHALELPKLKSLKLYLCDNLRVQESMPSMEKLIPMLEKLTIDDQGFNAINQSGVFPAELFSKLKKVTVMHINAKSIPFLSGFLQRLNSVETLVFEYDSIDLESLFDDEKAVGEKEHHSRLKHLELSSLRGLKHIVKKESPLNSILQHLQTLIVAFCGDLMDIAPSSTSFHNLTTLNISYCTKMKKLVTCSTAKTMVQLVRMRVESCHKIEEIIAADANCTNHDVINFSKLKFLELENLSKINSFCSGRSFSLPLLEKVTVKSCPQMKSFCSGELSTPKLRGMIFDDEQQWEGNLNATIACQLRDWVGVHFEDWKFFQRVKSVTMVKDAFSLKVMSANQIQFLHRLKRIVVKDCELVQVVFDLEGLCVENGHVGIMLPNLDELKLVNLPRLSKLCSKPPAGVVDFNKLTVLKIDNCGVLEYAFNWSMAACLVQLQTIELRNCEAMQSIIKAEEADDATTVVFRSLKTVVLKCLPKLFKIYLGNGDLEWPLLENISIRECPSFRGFISRLPREEGNGKEVFPSLHELSLDIKSIIAILRSELPKNFFSSVKKLELLYSSVKKVGSYAHLLHFLSSLPSLDELEIHTSSLEESFKFERLNILEEVMTLPQITSLKLKNIADVKQIWWRNASLFQSLKTLKVRDCGDLISLASSSTSFQNLTTLIVYGCDQLISLITPSVVKSMVQLEMLRVECCDVLKEIVGDGHDGTMDVLFTKLKRLELSDLQSLQNFSSGNCSFQFPCLENVVLWRCPNLKTFCAGTIIAPKLYHVQHCYWFLEGCNWKGDINSTIQWLYMSMVGFLEIYDAKLTIFPLLKEKWGDQIPVEYFSRLRKLVVDDCAWLSNAISPHLLQQLEWLMELKVEKCEALEQVFDLEGLNAYECQSELLKELNQLRLVDLPRLRHVWSKDPQQILSFINLQLLEVQNCGKLTYIFDLSMALRLPKLEHVEVKNCNSVEHIIVKAEDETMQECQTIFPSLQSIGLQNLTSLSSFYSTTGFLECPSLKMVELVECPNMELFPSTFSNGQDSCVDFEEREEKISCKDPNSKPAFLGNGIAIPVLDELKVEWKSLKCIFDDNNQLEFLSRLKIIELIGLPGGYGILPPNFLQFFPKLEKLSLSDALIEEINLHQLSSLEGDDNESLALLSTLMLSKLPKLKHLVCDDFPRVAIFQNLEVVECSRLKILVPPSVSFQNLTILKVWNCDGMINLISSSTARSLVQLKEMEVKECKMMEGIIAVGSDGGKHEIRFSQLEHLNLVDLPCLESFCSGKFDLNFPSLELVVVIGCPNMKKFASSVTPKLKKVYTGWIHYEWEWEGNLDNTIQALHAEKEDEEMEPQVCDRRD